MSGTEGAMFILYLQRTLEILSCVVIYVGVGIPLESEWESEMEMKNEGNENEEYENRYPREP